MKNQICDINYWKIILDISRKHRLTTKDAIKKYYELTNYPSGDINNLLLSQTILVPYLTRVKVTDNRDLLNKHYIPEYFAGVITTIEGITCSKEMVTYLLKDCDNYYFKIDTFTVLE